MIRNRFLLAYFGQPFFAAPTDVPPGTVQPPAPTLESRLSAAQGDVTRITAERDTLTGQVASLTGERDTARTEAGNLRSQFDLLTTTANETRMQLTTAQGQVTSLTGERDTVRNQHAAALANVTRLEKLCGLKGIDPAQAVVQEQQTSPALSVADWEAKMKSAKTPAERVQVRSDFEKAVKDKRIAK